MTILCTGTIVFLGFTSIIHNQFKPPCCLLQTTRAEKLYVICIIFAVHCIMKNSTYKKRKLTYKRNPRKNKRGGSGSRKLPSMGPSIGSLGRGPGGTRKRSRSGSRGNSVIPYAKQPKWLKQALVAEVWKGGWRSLGKNPKSPLDHIIVSGGDNNERKILNELLKNDNRAMHIMSTQNPPTFPTHTPQPKWMRTADAVQEWADAKKDRSSPTAPPLSLFSNSHADTIEIMTKNDGDAKMSKYAKMLEGRVKCVAHYE